MKKKYSKRKTNDKRGLTNVNVSQYKSINEEISINIEPLTILAGTNSSGKSSFIQPLLLMKQTLEESFDPGALLLNGPNVRFSQSDQLLHTSNEGHTVNTFSVGYEIAGDAKVKLHFVKGKTGFLIDFIEYKVPKWQTDESKNQIFTLNTKMKGNELLDIVPDHLSTILKKTKELEHQIDLEVRRSRCFLKVVVAFKDGPSLTDFPIDIFEREIRKIIHLPGLRGNPERNYPTTAADSETEELFLPGTFEKYVASIVTQWQTNDIKKLNKLEKHLKLIGLTSKIKAEKINDTQVALNIGRNLDENSRFVNIADVGIGVSQTLPLIVALIFAQPGQVVYIEQPEIHLHPNAQYIFANIIGEAAQRGVKVIIETHSSLLLKGIQTMVAKGEIPHDIVKLHWFSKNSNDETKVTSATLNKEGSFGEWPVDFDDIEIKAENNYLNAVEKNFWG